MTQAYDVLAIGSGHNGLVAAAYLAAGASGIFVPFLRDVAAIEQIVKRTGALVNVLPGSGEVDSRALADAGVARISYGGGPWFAAMAWLEEQARSAIGMTMEISRAVVCPLRSPRDRSP